MTHRDPIDQADYRGSEGAPETLTEYADRVGLPRPAQERKKRPLTAEELDEMDRDHGQGGSFADLWMRDFRRLIAGCREAIELREKLTKSGELLDAAVSDYTAAEARIAELERLAREVVNLAPRGRHLTAPFAEKLRELAAALPAAETTEEKR